MNADYFRFSGIPVSAFRTSEIGNRNSEAGGSAGIGPPWRDDFVPLSGLRKPACPGLRLVEPTARRVRRDVDMQLFSLLYECLTFHHRILTCQVWARVVTNVFDQLDIYHVYPVILSNIFPLVNCYLFPLQYVSLCYGSSVSLLQPLPKQGCCYQNKPNCYCLVSWQNHEYSTGHQHGSLSPIQTLQAVTG